MRLLLHCVGVLFLLTTTGRDVVAQDSLVPSGTDALALRARAIELSAQHNSGLAVLFMEAALRLHPSSPTLHNDLAVILWRAADPQGAALVFANASHASPKDETILDNMADLQSWLTGEDAIDNEKNENHGSVYPADASDVASPRASLRKRRPLHPVEHHVDPLPHIVADQLLAEQNFAFADGQKLFALDGALQDWPALSTWNLDHLQRHYGDVIVDYYQSGSRFQFDTDARPIRMPMHSAIALMKLPTIFEPQAPGQYFHWNLRMEDWRRIAAEIGALPAPFARDLELVELCMGNDSALVDDLMWREHWGMVLVATRGAGMFIHQDYLRSSSWQAQILGRKRWHLCDNEQTPFIQEAGSVSGFDPDYSASPEFRKAHCYQEDVAAGQMFFYYMDTWHQTVNLDEVNIALSSTVVDRHNWQHIHKQFLGRCTSTVLPYSKEICDQLPVCFDAWKRFFESAPHSEL